MVSGTVDTSCFLRKSASGHPVDFYGKPAPHPVIVNRLQPRSGAFFPDKSLHFPDIFVDGTSMQNLSVASQGRSDFSIKVGSKDYPGLSLAIGAAFYSHDMKDADALLDRHLHHGFFYTYVVARNRATSALIPLYTARWWASADYSFFYPDKTLPVNHVKHDFTFNLIDHHRFTRSDFFPVTTGIPINEWGKEHRDISEADRCPTHSQEIIRFG